METSQQAGICRQARFVLWSLRWAVLHHRGDTEAEAQVAVGFAMNHIPNTADQFWSFANALCASGMRLDTWHHPHCSCVSTEELMVLRLLAETAGRRHSAEPAPCQWWSVLLPPNSIPTVDAAARAWLVTLEHTGVMFPGPAELIESLRPIELLAMSPAATPSTPSIALH